MRGDRAVAELACEARLPIALEPGGQERVERRVERGVGHRAHVRTHRLHHVEERLDHLLALFDRAGPARHRETHVLEVPLLGQEREGRGEVEAHEATQFLRRLGDVLAVHPHDLVGSVDRVGDRPAVHLRDRVEAVLEGRDDPEVAPTAAQRPEQVAVLGLARGDDVTARRHDLGRQEVVARQPVLAGEVADPSAQGEPGDPGRADDAARGRQTVLVGRVVETRPLAATAGARGLRVGIDGDLLQRTQVDHETAVVGAETRGAVRTAADRQVETLAAGDLDDGGDVGGPGTADDRRRPLVDHPVEDVPGILVFGVSGCDDVTRNA